LLAERFCAVSVRDGCRRSEVVLQQRLHEALEGRVCLHGGGGNGGCGVEWLCRVLSDETWRRHSMATVR